MKIWNITDVVTPELEKRGHGNLPVAVGSYLLAPGDVVDIPDDVLPALLHAIRDYESRGIVAYEMLPPAYAVQKDRMNRRLRAKLPMTTIDNLPGISPTVRAFVASVREYMRDMPELNRLTAGEESTDRQIAWAVVDAVSDFNGTPHFTNLSIEELLLTYNQHALLRRMTVCTLLESIGLLQTRNHLNYSNGGLNVGANDKTPMLMEWMRMFRGAVEQRKQQVKVAMNISAALGCGGVHSEYWALNSTYASY